MSRGMDDLVADYLEKAEASGNSPFGKRSEEDPPEEGMEKPGESLKPPMPEQQAKPGMPPMAGKPPMPGQEAKPGMPPMSGKPPMPGQPLPAKPKMPGAPPMGQPGQAPGMPQKPGMATGAPSGEAIAGKLPAPSIHEDQASLEAALSKVSHLGEKGFRSLHPDTQQELISDGYLDPQGNLTAAGHKELVTYFAKHAANPNLGPQAQQKAAMRNQAHTEAAGQEANGHPAVHAAWQQKQIEMRSGGMQPGQAPGMPGNQQPMGQGAPQMGGQVAKPFPPQGPPQGQPGQLGAQAKPPMPGQPEQRLPPSVVQGGAMPPAHEAPPAQPMQGKPGVPPVKPAQAAKPVPPQFQKSGLDDLGDYLEKAMGGGHKYIRRTGAPGSYEYTYAHPKTGEYTVGAQEHFKRQKAASRKEGFGQQALPMGRQAPAKTFDEVHGGPGGLKEKVAEWDKKHPEGIKLGPVKPKATITDVTPAGYGPGEAGKEQGGQHHNAEAERHGKLAEENYRKYHSIPSTRKDERSLASIKAQHHNAMQDYHNAMSFAGDLSDEARPKHLEFAAGRKKEADQHKAESEVFQDRLDTANRRAKMAAEQSEKPAEKEPVKFHVGTELAKISEGGQAGHDSISSDVKQALFDRKLTTGSGHLTSSGHLHAADHYDRKYQSAMSVGSHDEATVAHQRFKAHKQAAQQVTQGGQSAVQRHWVNVSKHLPIKETEEAATEATWKLQHPETETKIDHPAVEKYIRAIKNPAKKAYAEAYAKWKQGGEKGAEPEHGSLSYMGAQAVRLHTDNILSPRPKMEGISGFEKPVGEKPQAEAQSGKFIASTGEPGSKKFEYTGPVNKDAREEASNSEYHTNATHWATTHETGAAPYHEAMARAHAHLVEGHGQLSLGDQAKAGQHFKQAAKVFGEAVKHGKDTPNGSRHFEQVANSLKLHAESKASDFAEAKPAKIKTAKPKSEAKPAKLKTVKMHQSGGMGNPTTGSDQPVKHHVGNLAVNKDPMGTGYHVTHIPSGKRVASSGKLSDAKGLANHIHAAAPNAMDDLKFGELPDPRRHNTEIAKMQAAIKTYKPLKKSEGLDELGDYLQKAEAIPGGLGSGKSAKDFDPKSLAQGMKVEAEHSPNPKVQREIAEDHLTEDPQYYKKLARMEKSGRVDAAIADLLQRDPHPEDSQVHALAGKLGMKVDDLEERIYAMAGKAKRMEKCAMQKSGLNELGDYLNKADGMPAQNDWDEIDKPAEQTLGGSPNGGDLTETPTPESNGGCGCGEGQDKQGQVTGAPSGQTDIFGDDRPAEQQMTPGTSAIEDAIPEGYKSMTPANQRDMVAKEHAQKVAQLQKSHDVRVGGNPHPYSMAETHGGTDADAANLCKSEFYTGGQPMLAPPGAIIRQTVLCKSEGCGCKYPALLTSCPSCGDGMVKSRMLPKSAYLGGDGNEAVILEKAVFDPIIKPAPVDADVYIPGPSPVVTRRSTGR